MVKLLKASMRGSVPSFRRLSERFGGGSAADARRDLAGMVLSPRVRVEGAVKIMVLDMVLYMVPIVLNND